MLNEWGIIKVSIIIPVYNVSQYLRRCLDSCIHQTMQEIEIIVVNDCSPDPLDTEIMKEYEMRYPDKVRCIWHSENTKQGGARNTGIRVAKGEFLYFVDSDDYIDLTLCQKMYDSIVTNDADMSFCDYDRIEKNGNIACSANNGKFVSDNLTDRIKSLRAHTAWLIMIKKSIIVDNNLFFPEGLLFEDLQCVLWYLGAKKIAYVKEILFHYVIRDNSTMHSYKLEPYEMGLKVIASIVQSSFFQELPREVREMIILYLMQEVIAWTDMVNLCHPNSLPDYCKKILKLEKAFGFNLNAMVYDSECATYIKNMIAFIKLNAAKSDFCLQYSSYSAYQADLYALSLCYNRLQKYAGKRITIWGAGKHGGRNCKILKRLGVHVEVTDLNEKLYGKKMTFTTVVKPWIELRDVTDVVLTSVVGHFDEIRAAVLQESPSIEVINFEDLIRRSL